MASTSANPADCSKTMTKLEWRMSVRSLITPQTMVEPQLRRRDDAEHDRRRQRRESYIGDVR